jgi:hypothetical protein
MVETTDLTEALEAIYDYFAVSDVPAHIITHFETITKAVKIERNSSITLGTPAKGGEVKVYLDLGNPEECGQRIVNAYVCLNQMEQERAMLSSEK